MPFVPSGMQLVAHTPVAGFALQNGTPSLGVQWTAPNDGNPHAVVICGEVNCSVATTGGAVAVTYTAPDGTVNTNAVFQNGSVAVGIHPVSSQQTILIAPGSTITAQQSTAMTAGAAVEHVGFLAA